MLPSCRAQDSFKQEFGWDASGGPFATSISATPSLCHPIHDTDCFFLVLSYLSSSGSVSSLG